MTVLEQHTEFKVLYDKVDSFNNKTYTPEEIDIFLNNAMNLILSEITKEGLESNSVFRNYTRNLTSNSNITSFVSNANNKPNGKFVTLPVDCRIVLEEECLIDYTDCHNQPQTKRIVVTPLTHDKYNRAVRNPFTSPYDEEIYQLPYGTSLSQNTVELITDGTYVINTYYLRYLRQPSTIQLGSQYVTPTTDVDCELYSDQAHREVVAIAVEMALGKLENISRYNIQAVEVNKLR